MVAEITIKVAGPFASGKTTLLLKYFDAMRALAKENIELRVLSEFKSTSRNIKLGSLERIRDELMISIEFGSDALEVMKIEAIDKQNPENTRIYNLIAGPGHKNQWQALISLWNNYKPEIFYMLVDGATLAKYIDDYETFSKYLKIEVWADYMAPQDIQYLRSIKGCIGILVNKRDLLEEYPMKLTIIEDFLERFISDLKRDYANVIIHGSVISLRKMDTLRNPQQILSLPCTPYIRLISARKK